jgi:hypothetical protein
MSMPAALGFTIFSSIPLEVWIFFAFFAIGSSFRVIKILNCGLKDYTGKLL